VEVWKLESSKVLDILLPKIKKQYPNKKKGNSKDPRIGVTISTKQIKKNGERIR
jgi:RNase P protein component